MASVAHSGPDFSQADRDAIKPPVDDWFEASGVPHFIHRYSATKRLPDLSIVLCVVLAFELGVAPWLEFSALELIVTPIVLLVLTMTARPLLVLLFDLEQPTVVGPLSSAFRGLLVGLAVGYLLDRMSGPRMDAWVNFGLLLGSFAAATVLFSRPLWIGRDRAARRSRRQLLLLLLAAIVVFTVEGSVTGPANEELGLDGMPQGIPALAVVALLLTLAIRLSRRCRAEQAALVRPPPAADFQLAAVPPLLVILGGETAVLPHVAEERWVQAVVPLALMLASLAVAALATTTMARPKVYTAGAATARRTPAAAIVAPCALALMFALGYPILAGLYFTVDAFGRSYTGVDAFSLTFGINALCVCVGWLFVSLGVDRIAVWTAHAAWRSRLTVLAGIARGLPLLLVFLAFFVMQAELWEVVVEIGSTEYLGLVAVMLVLSVAFGYVAAHKEVVRHSRFKSWRDVYKSAVPGTDALHEPPLPEPFRTRLKEISSQPGEPGPAQLTGFKYLNAVAIVGVYQTVILLPVTLAAAALFWLLGRIAVPSSVAGEWVYGDGAPPSRGEALLALPFLDQPWTRVAVVLGAFSALYLAVNVLSTDEQRRDFFEGADESVRQRLAVRVAYVRLVPADRDEDLPRPTRLRGALRRRRDAPGSASRASPETP